ncbi:hypothetical protein VF14_03050 [Nostoc linckia z18]|uniref:NACHT domain-containing NTPase n=2 Tax=Nostoc linckia TaxID=92942 RepID=A0A9Q6ENF2_NOSLI|nr:NACHT domain-containing NTPase [Nostoc linckia]PHK42360.1 hypothetical protein VF12_03065 [Nostoc linckia z15]PHK46801.1 hypothetical protein VF13_08935 [Nostoc linckia z16]PHJ69130.1 hypothetical protein VF02_00520 [Nostoc linckia z1]PHJ73281.1 hypothetical protein VF05_01535 [Nostoc linckia z3]PHJ78628.1 hypothetical protein VF03_00520 [Nostoc linckia z2]
MTRSVRASKTGLEKAKEAFKLKGWTQEYLAGGSDCSRQTINKFLKGQPVDKSKFQGICTELGLEWGEIAELEAEERQAVKTFSVDELVQEVREKLRPYIQQRYGTMRVLDMTEPVDLSDIYTDVNIFGKITGRRRLEIADLLKNSDPEKFDRIGLSPIVGERIPGLEAVQQHSKLMVLGKPGAGKTTFLKHLAIQCIKGQFFGDRFPVFITLKDFAEADKKPDVLEYIALQLSKCKVTDGSTKAEQLLEHGKTLVLFDGLDEVREEDAKRVLDKVEEFSYQFHKNQFVITCRIAAKEYTFKDFTEVEVADFNSDQIATFAQNWFRQSDPVKSEHFIQKLDENEPIQELATNPLLLTLLCLVFGEVGNFPNNRSELYKEGIDVLLKKWDVKRNIERDEIYKGLSLKRKEDLLSQIALTTFKQKDYFFKKQTAEKYISEFIYNLPNARTEPEELEVDSEAVLKSIEAQHGLLVARATNIYSFSHLTFQEYFAAREIVANSDWENLVKHITDKRWREVFLLTAAMMRNADNLVELMKQKIDGLVAKDENFQRFLKWISQKSETVDTSCKMTAIRGYYITRALAETLSSANPRDAIKLIEELPLVSSLDSNLKDEKQKISLIINHFTKSGSQFSNLHKKLLQQYYDANKLLVDCLNSECYVSREVRQRIEDTLLLPVKTSL